MLLFLYFSGLLVTYFCKYSDFSYILYCIEKLSFHIRNFAETIKTYNYEIRLSKQGSGPSAIWRIW